MSDRMKKHAQFLHALSTAFKKDRKKGRKILKGAGSRQINALSEVAKNVVKGRIPISPETKAGFCKYIKIARQIADKNIPAQKRKRLMLQKGGLAILPLILSGLVSSIIGTIVKKVAG